jgi:undecaprenyl-diphosphatase
LSFSQIAILALVQGVTEFLPISSYAHLIVTRDMMGLPEAALSFDVAVHVGTLGAVVVYYWRDICAMTVGLFRLVTGRGGPGARLFGLIVIATVPVVIAGVLVKLYVGDALESVKVIAWATVVFAVLLYLADKMCMTLRRIEHMSVGQALLIGLAQAVALIPGTSRSGITMTAARVMGFERTESVRFSLLLSVPTIAAAGVLEGLEVYESGTMQFQLDLALAATISFVAALAAIPLMVAWLRHATFTPFVIYRFALGGVLLLWVYMA